MTGDRRRLADWIKASRFRLRRHSLWEISFSRALMRSTRRIKTFFMDQQSLTTPRFVSNIIVSTNDYGFFAIGFIFEVILRPRMLFEACTSAGEASRNLICALRGIFCAHYCRVRRYQVR